jgi:hypothetical protein
MKVGQQVSKFSSNVTCSTQRGSSDDLPAGWSGAMHRSEHSTDPLSPHSQEDSTNKRVVKKCKAPIKV